MEALVIQNGALATQVVVGLRVSSRDIELNVISKTEKPIFHE